MATLENHSPKQNLDLSVEAEPKYASAGQNLVNEAYEKLSPANSLSNNNEIDEASLNRQLSENIYAQRRTYERPSNETDEEYLQRQQRTREAIQRGGMRGLNEGTQNAEDFLNQTGRIRVRQGNGVFGNPVDRNPATRPAGIYPGPGRDMTIDVPSRW
ncbi:MAG: hypothetical protein SFV17_07935 [Candidatus Obscuribacter sp.]|nr:hypothetical protein [Candidatus Melainabacteria bacterium]MDX1986602.1 hypothetical protein [Candidatus Obscuribacter sp.]